MYTHQWTYIELATTIDIYVLLLFKERILERKKKNGDNNSDIPIIL